MTRASTGTRFSRARWVVVALFVSMAASTLMAIVSPTAASAQETVTCWSVSDGPTNGSADILVRIDDAFGNANAFNVGTMTTTDAEAMAIRPGMDASFIWVWDSSDGLDIIDTSVNPPTASNAPFSVGGSKVEGMTWVNVDDADPSNDQLFVIRGNGNVEGFSATGTSIYAPTSVLIDGAAKGDDIAWDAASDSLIAVISGNGGSRLVDVPAAGGVATNARDTEADLEGLGYASNGVLIGTSGASGANSLHSINAGNGDEIAELINFPTDPGTNDHEAVDCIDSAIAMIPIEAEITSPVSGSTLDCGDLVVTWTTNADEHRLIAGTSIGASDIFDGPALGDVTTGTISGLPEDGSTVYVTLEYNATGGDVMTYEVSYTACTAVAIVATINSPADGSTIAECGDVVLMWTGNADEYQVTAGSAVGGSQYFDSGALGDVSMVTIDGLPDDGSTIHVRLWYNETGGDVMTTDVTYTACTPISATIDSPADGATIADCGDVVVMWTSNADEHELTAGSEPGASDYYDSGALGDVASDTMTGLPENGENIFVRLSYNATGGDVMTTDVTYTACTADPDPMASISAPADGTVFTECGDVALTWTGNVDEYWVYAGSSVGAFDYYDSGNLGNVFTTTMTGLPTDGSTINVRLWYRVTDGAWMTQDVTYTACADDPLVVTITDPVAGATLDCGSDTVTWTGNADEYWVYAGSEQGGFDYYDSGNLGNVLTDTITGLPDDNTNVWIRVWFRATGGAWSFVDQPTVACTDIQPGIVSPVDGTTVDFCEATIVTWTGDAEEYWVYVGSTAGGREYHDSGNLGNVLTYTVPAVEIPTADSDVFVRVWYRTGDMPWNTYDNTYVAAIDCAGVDEAVTSPVDGSAIAECGDVALTWVGDADEYWVYAGSTAGASDYYNSGNLGNVFTDTMTGLPTDGSTINVRLWHRTGSMPWQSIDVSYTACTAVNDPMASISTPAAGSALDCGDVVVTWTGDADEYQLIAGTSVGANDLYNSGVLGNVLTATMTGLPEDASTINVRLWFRFTDGEWFSQDITYTACTAPPVANITSPIDGATLACGPNLIAWSGDADEYQVYAGSSVGASNYFDSGIVTGNATSLDGLPGNGETVFVRLWFRDTGGDWFSQDVTYTACTLAATASITSPAVGPALPCGATSIALTWSGNADEYQVYAGNTVGGLEYFDSGNLGNVSTVSVTGLPTDGSTINVRFWYRFTGEAWMSQDVVYISCADVPPAGLTATIVSPINEATILNCGDIFMFWNGTADEYQVYAGNTVGGNEYYDSGVITGNVTSLSGLPTDGSNINVRLWFRATGGTWFSTDVTYTACTA